VERLKSDKKTIFGEVSFAGEQAAKAAKAVKNAFGRLRQQGRKLLAGNQEGSGERVARTSAGKIAACRN
jgi:hypothetical protein